MHVALFRETCRFTAAELASLQSGTPEDPCWNPSEALVIRVVDELHEDSTLSDGTWEKLRAAYDSRALVELTLTVGNYHMLAFFLNACRIPLEDGSARFV
jgi:hypothetical protein